MILRFNRSYTLVEIVIVTAVLAIITAITLGNYLTVGKVSAKNICISNLKQIDGAIEQWAFDNNIGAGTVPSALQEDAIYGYINGEKPKCPSKGEYTIYALGNRPQVKCSREEDEGHKLPE